MGVVVARHVVGLRSELAPAACIRACEATAAAFLEGSCSRCPQVTLHPVCLSNAALPRNAPRNPPGTGVGSEAPEAETFNEGSVCVCVCACGECLARDACQEATMLEATWKSCEEQFTNNNGRLVGRCKESV